MAGLVYVERMNGIQDFLARVFRRVGASAGGGGPSAAERFEAAAAALSDDERATLVDEAMRRDAVRVLRGLPEIGLGEQRRGYSRDQVDRVRSKLALVPDDLMRWRDEADQAALASVQLVGRIPNIRFEEEKQGYDKDQVDALLAEAQTAAGLGDILNRLS